MNRLDIKPLSVNEAWQGRRFKTPDYKSYESALLLILPRTLKVPESGYLSLYLEVGFSSKASDWDNPIKPFQDVLQKKYHFNDNRIKSSQVEVYEVPKGQEYIIFEIKQLKRSTIKKVR
jgi:Holliday junction resolvase RusA-like endonuclease